MSRAVDRLDCEADHFPNRQTLQLCYFAERIYTGFAHSEDDNSEGDGDGDGDVDGKAKQLRMLLCTRCHDANFHVVFANSM